jgi:hypothetical protein
MKTLLHTAALLAGDHEEDCKLVDGKGQRDWYTYRCWVEGDKEKRAHKWVYDRTLGQLKQGDR